MTQTLDGIQIRQADPAGYDSVVKMHYPCWQQSYAGILAPSMLGHVQWAKLEQQQIYPPAKLTWAVDVACQSQRPTHRHKPTSGQGPGTLIISKSTRSVSRWKTNLEVPTASRLITLSAHSP